MTREWPSREEWAADAERSVHLACFSLERVPVGVEHYLTAEELTERDVLLVALSAAARKPLTTEISRLRAELPSTPPSAPAERSMWFYALAEQHQRAWSRIQDLERARREIGRRARGIIDDQFGYTVLHLDVVEFVEDRDALERLRALETAYETRRLTAADKAVEEAIAKTVARRNSDAGWAAELKRRARIDGGPVIT